MDESEIMGGYAILNEDGNIIMKLEGDMLKVYPDRNEIHDCNILVAYVPKSMLILRCPVKRI